MTSAANEIDSFCCIRLIEKKFADWNNDLIAKSSQRISDFILHPKFQGDIYYDLSNSNEIAKVKFTV